MQEFFRNESDLLHEDCESRGREAEPNSNYMDLASEVIRHGLFMVHHCISMVNERVR